ncbi:hypothetical protein [Lacrimispora sp. 210928-DFI.3.58]|nr:hypothetical protein [Lacrimispora sp. 210928-DFI.3.58]
MIQKARPARCTCRAKEDVLYKAEYARRCAKQAKPLGIEGVGS